jgi:hypothetical protein
MCNLQSHASIQLFQRSSGCPLGGDRSSRPNPAAAARYGAHGVLQSQDQAQALVHAAKHFLLSLFACPSPAQCSPCRLLPTARSNNLPLAINALVSCSASRLCLAPAPQIITNTNTNTQLAASPSPHRSPTTAHFSTRVQSVAAPTARLLVVPPERVVSRIHRPGPERAKFCPCAEPRHVSCGPNHVAGRCPHPIDFSSPATFQQSLSGPPAPHSVIGLTPRSTDSPAAKSRQRCCLSVLTPQSIEGRRCSLAA